jgi:hypothetical protein
VAGDEMSISDEMTTRCEHCELKKDGYCKGVPNPPRLFICENYAGEEKFK